MKLNFLANLGGSNIECLSSCQDIVENTPFVENFLKVRCLPGDKLSIRKFTFCYSLYQWFIMFSNHEKLIILNNLCGS